MSENQTNQAPVDIELAAIELWRQTKNDSSDADWERVLYIRKDAYRRMATAILDAAGCLGNLRAEMPHTQGDAP